MTRKSPIEHLRDDADFETVYSDEEHDHAAESAREKVDHVEAAGVKKDYAAPPRKDRVDRDRSARRNDAQDVGDGESGAEGREKSNEEANNRSRRHARPKDTTLEPSATPMRAKAAGAIAESAMAEIAGEDDTGTLAGLQTGTGSAKHLKRRLAASSARRIAEGGSQRNASRHDEGARMRAKPRRRNTPYVAPDATMPAPSALRVQTAAKSSGFIAKAIAAVTAALPAAAGAAAVVAAVALVCAIVVAVLSFSWFWDAASRKTSVDLPPGCEALRGEVESVCTEVFGNDDWSNMVLAIMAAESGGDLSVAAAGGATYVYCVGGCGTPLSTVRQDVMQASECGYGGIIVHGAASDVGVTCCPSVGSWPYSSVGASTAKASIYAGALYLRDGLEMWGNYLGEIKPPDVGKLALVAQGYNYNMSSWFAWCKARGITEYSLEVSEQFQLTLPVGYKGTANHAEKVMRFYPYGHAAIDGSEAQASLALMATGHATNDIYYQQYCARWANDMYDKVFGAGTCSRYPSAWLDWCANKAGTSMEDIPLGAAVYGSGWGYPGMGNSNPYGHVGIYVGDGNVADYSGIHDLRSWAASQSAVCNGHIGWLGWGWLSNDDLTTR